MLPPALLCSAQLLEPAAGTFSVSVHCPLPYGHTRPESILLISTSTSFGVGSRGLGQVQTRLELSGRWAPQLLSGRTGEAGPTPCMDLLQLTGIDLPCLQKGQVSLCWAPGPAIHALRHSRTGTSWWSRRGEKRMNGFEFQVFNKVARSW